MFAIDTTNSKIWFGYEGEWEDDVTPEVNGSGNFYNLSGGPWFATASATVPTPTQQGTMRFVIADFDFAVPSGFSPLGA